MVVEFIVYADNNYKNLIMYYPDKKKLLTVPFDFQRNNLTAVIPEYQFDSMKLDGSILTLFYTRTDNKKLNLTINLKNTKYSH